MREEKPLSPRASIFVGLAVSLAGIAIVLAALLAPPEKFHAPRWVVASAGGAFVFFGGWIAAIYARGFDPKRPGETLPSPAVQLAVFVPGLLCFAAPFHWIAFWPGPRHFSTSFSIPFLAVHRSSSGWGGRVAFGIGALLIDAMLVAIVVRLVRQMHRKESLSSPAP